MELANCYTCKLLPFEYFDNLLGHLALVELKPNKANPADPKTAARFLLC